MLILKNEKIVLFLFVVVFGACISTSIDQNTLANPISIVNIANGICLLADGSYNVSMQFADVLFNIDADKDTRHATINYSGNYSFYNSNNTEQKLAVGLPFTFDLDEDKISVFVNNVKTNFTTIELTPEIAQNYSLYFSRWDYVDLILCNVTFEEVSFTNILVEYNSYETSVEYYETYIEYIVGTANSWDNSSNIYERVEFKVMDFQPIRHADDCTVTTITGGKSYLWLWENEPITVDSVWIGYEHHTVNPAVIAIFVIVGGVIGVISTIALLMWYFLVKKNKKKII